MAQHPTPSATPAPGQAGELDTLKASFTLLETDVRILSQHYLRLQAEHRLLFEKLEEKAAEIERLTLAMAGKAPLPAPGPAAGPAAGPAPGQAPASTTAVTPAAQAPRASGDGGGGILSLFQSKKTRENNRLKRLAARCQQAGLFDPQWYLLQNPDVKAAGMDPGVHFIRFGLPERRKPHPDFSWYLHEAQLLALVQSQTPATTAAPAPRSSGTGGGGILSLFQSKKTRENNRLKRLAARCQQAGLFDPQWYLLQNPDVKAADMDPGVHFLRFGLPERRKPHPDFNWSLHEAQLLALVQG